LGAGEGLTGSSFTDGDSSPVVRHAIPADRRADLRSWPSVCFSWPGPRLGRGRGRWF